MVRCRSLPAAILALMVTAGLTWAQKQPASCPQEPSQASFSAQNNADDIVSLLVDECLQMWALLWEHGQYPEAGTMAGEACRLDPGNSAAECARVLSQLANTTRFVHPAAGCPHSCTAVAVPAAQVSRYDVPCKARTSSACGACTTGCGEVRVCKPINNSFKPSGVVSVLLSQEECSECPPDAPCCCETKKTCACDSGCRSATNKSGCSASKTSCCTAPKASCCPAPKTSCSASCCCAPVSCSCCTTCSCSKPSNVSAPPADGNICTFLQMLHSVPQLHGQAHSLVIMNPVPNGVFPFPLPPGHPGMDGAQPGAPMMVPPMPSMTRYVEGQVMMPVVRPPMTIPTPFAPQSMEMVGFPTAVPAMPMSKVSVGTGGNGLQVRATGKRISLSCPQFNARCDRISYLPGANCVVLEGKVRVRLQGKDAGKISAERIEIDVVDGTMEIAPASPQSRPVVPVGFFKSEAVPPQSAILRIAPMQP